MWVVENDDDSSPNNCDERHTQSLQRIVRHGSRFAERGGAGQRDAARNLPGETITEMLREFTDKSGATWRVWDVYPTTRASAQWAGANVDARAAHFPTHEMADGWLCFESGSEKRRLAPIPPDWETCEACVLEELCSKARYATRTPSSDSPTVDR